jgi:glutamate--cysteine ligase
LPALWVGLLYDGTSLDAACGLVADWTEEEREAMRRDVPRLGLETPHRSRTLRDVALEVLEIAREGLHRRARRSLAGEDETHFLDNLFSIAGSGRTPAEELIEDYNTRWGGRIEPIFTEYAY